MVLSSDEVVVALNTNEHDPSCEDEDEVGFEEDGNALIDQIRICWVCKNVILCINMYISLWVQKEMGHFCEYSVENPKTYDILKWQIQVDHFTIRGHATDILEHVFKCAPNWIFVPLDYHDTPKLTQTWNE